MSQSATASASGSQTGVPDVPARGLVIIALALGTFIQVLDTTIANVSIPTIAGNLGVSSSQGTWVITSFAVANGISLPLTGWLMQRYGVVKTFVASVALFTLASFLCGVAWSIESLIFFRILQGAVSGPMIPGSQALLMSLFPPNKKGSALGIWSMMTLVAPVCGPIFGGYISDNFAWQWIFLINVPVGIACSVICWRGLRHLPTNTRKLPIDGIGLGLLVIWVGALQIMLDLGKDRDWFASPLIVTLAIVALIGVVTFYLWERDEKHPIVNLSLFKDRNFLVGTIALCLGFAVLFASIVVQPLWMQTWLGYNATWAGLATAPSGLVAMFIAPIVGRKLDSMDARLLASVSFMVLTFSFYLRTGYNAEASFFAYVVPMLFQGVAISAFLVAIMAIALQNISPQQMPAASGLMNFMRITTGSFATSLVTTFWEHDAVRHQTQLVEGVDPTVLQQSIDSLANRGMTDIQAIDRITELLLNQAYLKSIIDFFAIAGWISLIAVVLVWFSKRASN